MAQNCCREKTHARQHPQAREFLSLNIIKELNDSYNFLSFGLFFFFFLFQVDNKKARERTYLVAKPSLFPPSPIVMWIGPQGSDLPL